MIADHSNLSGIIGSMAVGTPAAARAVAEAGLAGRIKVVGLSMPNLIKDQLTDGSVQMATFWSPRRLGYLTIALSVSALDGVSPYNGMSIENVGIIQVNGDVVVIGDTIDFTKENVGQYDY